MNPSIGDDYAYGCTYAEHLTAEDLSVLRPERGDVVLLWRSSGRRVTRTTGVPAHFNGCLAVVEGELPGAIFRVRLDFKVPPRHIPPGGRGRSARLLHGDAVARTVHIDELSDNLGNPSTWETWKPMTDEEYAKVERQLQEEWEEDRKHFGHLGRQWTFERRD